MNDPLAQLQLGVQHHQQGRLAEAEAIYRQVLAQEPDQPDALHLLGVALFQMGRGEQSIALVDRAIALSANIASYHTTRGNFLQARNCLDEALDSHRRAVALEPGNVDALSNFGNALARLGEYEAAVDALRNAVRLAPAFVPAKVNLGSALREAGRAREAIDVLREAVAQEPASVEARANLANALREEGRLIDAIEMYRQALALDPRPEVQSSMARALHDAGMLDEALAAYRQAMERAPADARIGANYLTALNYVDAVEPEVVAREHREWGRRHAHVSPVAPRARRAPADRRRLKIGYVSADFRAHAVAFFIEPVLAAHDHARFEIYCYSDVRKEDAVTARLRTYADQWREVSKLSDPQLADVIARDEIDILIDLAGHMVPNRLMVFARKPAPLQVTYLGYPNTTGLPQIDFRITDAVADPPGETERFHSENLLRPNPCFLCYRPPEDAPDVRRRTRSTGGITFGCFNRLAKVSAATLSLWAQVLRETPNSRLVLKWHGMSDPRTEARVCDHLQRHGLDPDRVTLLGQEPSAAQHLDRYNEIDVALDTFPYNGTTTTCEALWMGVPVVTMAGRSHVARVSASILSTVGLGDWNAHTPAEYVRIAAVAARDADRRQALHRTLREKMRSSPLMNARTFTATLENTLAPLLLEVISR
ncbi:MAG TPA: tetratricopeptide repeat protein [Tepidisphaeraceae bacterium]|jgi:predicted O-linked N-acetylglucosamine transferase (SPINDLY family)